MNIDQSQCLLTEVSLCDEEVFLRVTGLSKREWIEQEICMNGLSFAAAHKQYRRLLDDLVRRFRKVQDDDQKAFQAVLHAMEGAGGGR